LQEIEEYDTEFIVSWKSSISDTLDINSIAIISAYLFLQERTVDGKIAPMVELKVEKSSPICIVIHFRAVVIYR
jgi:hypothetical protein